MADKVSLIDIELGAGVKIYNNVHRLEHQHPTSDQESPEETARTKLKARQDAMRAQWEEIEARLAEDEGQRSDYSHPLSSGQLVRDAIDMG